MKKNQITIILVSAYLLCQIIADVTAVKIVGPIFGYFVPAAVFIYAVTFTLRDLVHRHLGKQETVTLVWSAAIVNVLMVLYFAFTIWLPAAPFWTMQNEYALVLGFVPRIVMASIVAELISELIDTEIYHKTKNLWYWMRVLFSNTVALFVDSVLFCSLAFYGTMPNIALFQVITGQLIVKGAITLISLPTIYLVKGD